MGPVGKSLVGAQRGARSVLNSLEIVRIVAVAIALMLVTDLL